MKKFFFSMVVVLMSTAMSYAQKKLVATLTHGDVITMYDGEGALGSAHNAAVSGDVITLSSGDFNGIEITKAVTIRGAGVDSETPTTIKSEMKFNIPESDTCRFSIEGVTFSSTYVYLYGSCSNPYFLKCNFKSQVYFSNSNNSYNSAIKDALFVNCKFTNSVNLGGTTTAKFSHCLLLRNSNDHSSSSTAQFINCIVSGGLSSFHRSSFVNSILCGTNNNSNAEILPAETVAMNCTAFSAQLQ